eukprot:g199.t1
MTRRITRSYSKKNSQRGNTISTKGKRKGKASKKRLKRKGLSVREPNQQQQQRRRISTSSSTSSFMSSSLSETSSVKSVGRFQQAVRVKQPATKITTTNDTSITQTSSSVSTSNKEATTTVIGNKEDIKTKLNQSSLIYLNLIKSSISNLCYLRGIFDEKLFRRVKWASTSTLLLPSEKDRKVIEKRFRKKTHDTTKNSPSSSPGERTTTPLFPKTDFDDALRITEWMNVDVRDALSRGYLKRLVFVIYLNDDCSDPLETYSFRFEQEPCDDEENIKNCEEKSKEEGGEERLNNHHISESVLQMRSTIKTTTTNGGSICLLPESKRKQERLLQNGSREVLKIQLTTIIRKLSCLVSSFEKLPSSRTISMIFYFTDETPEDYAPPNFRLVEETDEKMLCFQGPNPITVTQIGNVRTNVNDDQMNVSVRTKGDKEFQNQDEEVHEDIIEKRRQLREERLKTEAERHRLEPIENNRIETDSTSSKKAKDEKRGDNHETKRNSLVDDSTISNGSNDSNGYDGSNEVNDEEDDIFFRRRRSKKKLEELNDSDNESIESDREKNTSSQQFKKKNRNLLDDVLNGICSQQQAPSYTDDSESEMSTTSNYSSSRLEPPFLAKPKKASTVVTKKNREDHKRNKAPMKRLKKRKRISVARKPVHQRK